MLSPKLTIWTIKTVYPTEACASISYYSEINNSEECEYLLGQGGLNSHLLGCHQPLTTIIIQ